MRNDQQEWPGRLQALLNPTRRDVAAFHIHDAHCDDDPCYDANIEQHQGLPTADDYVRADAMLAALDNVNTVPSRREAPEMRNTQRADQAFEAAERLAPIPATRDDATPDIWVRHFAAHALAAHVAFDEAVRTVPRNPEPGSRPELGYLVGLGVSATAAAYALTHPSDVAKGLWDLTPEAGALNGEYIDWLADTLDRYGINPADIDPRFNRADFASQGDLVTRPYSEGGDAR